MPKGVSPSTLKTSSVWPASARRKHSASRGARSPVSLDIDPNGQITEAVASRDTWSGITIEWPVDGADERLAVELSGLPVFDRERHFGGYRGFGVCRDTRRISLAASLRQPPPPVVRAVKALF